MLEHFREIWLQVNNVYDEGFVVTEATLQAVLYCKIRKEIPDVNVIAEPTWELDDGINREPDLVIVRNYSITDIFELKFMVSYGEWQEDVDKLFGYVDNPFIEYPVQLNPYTGSYENPSRIHEHCRLHFVIVADYLAEGVQELNLQNYLRDRFPNHANNFYHWIGRNHNEAWEIVPINHE